MGGGCGGGAMPVAQAGVAAAAGQRLPDSEDVVVEAVAAAEVPKPSVLALSSQPSPQPPAFSAVYAEPGCFLELGALGCTAGYSSTASCAPYSNSSSASSAPHRTLSRSLVRASSAGWQVVVSYGRHRPEAATSTGTRAASAGDDGGRSVTRPPAPLGDDAATSKRKRQRARLTADSHAEDAENEEEDAEVVALTASIDLEVERWEKAQAQEARRKVDKVKPAGMVSPLQEASVNRGA